MSTNGNSEAEKGGAKKTCFIVCPIGNDLSPQRKHSDQALRHIIAPVLREAGFEEPYRADKISESGNITRQIINHIREDNLVIADLTGHNPNVFYELAIRHCTGLPFIQMIRKGESIPFDLGPMRTIFFDLTDPDDVVATKAELARQVASAMAKGAQVDTPIGAAMDFEKLASTGGTLERLVSTLIERVDGLERRNRPLPTNNLRRHLWDGRFLEDTAFEAGFGLTPSELTEVQKRVLDRLHGHPVGMSRNQLKDIIVEVCHELLPAFEEGRFIDDKQPTPHPGRKSRAKRA